MDRRKPLKPGTELHVRNHEGGQVCFLIGPVIGRGGSCLVYEGYYVNNSGTKNTVRIKECYPHNLHLFRLETGDLDAGEQEQDTFAFYKERIRQAFFTAQELHETEGLTNAAASGFDFYEAHHTVYMVSSYVEGNVLSEVGLLDLRAAVRAVSSTARGIGKIHEKGYLYLDIKPENLFMYRETPDLIQFVDFDSMIPMGLREPITCYRAAYSPGFAPLEQKCGDLSRMGTYTDIYSIGALLFYLLFGRAPGAADCGTEAWYDYRKRTWDRMYHPQVYQELTSLFHHTLQPYEKDRYSDVDEVLSKLRIIDAYAEKQAPFLCTGHVTECGLIVGRKLEIRELLNWYQSGEKLIFVTGMGGIGKSTVVYRFVHEYRDRFDQVIDLRFHGSVCETFADDTRFCIRGYERGAEEQTAEYAARKMRAVRELTAGTRTLLILDQFDGIINEEFGMLLDADWQVIVITRVDMRNSGYRTEPIGTLTAPAEYEELFERTLGRTLETAERFQAEQIVRLVHGHTLILVLIARQIARSYLDFAQAYHLVKTKGFSRMASEKVDYTKDGVRRYGEIAVLIRAIYDVGSLSGNKRRCLRFCALFPEEGVTVGTVKCMNSMESADEINELEQDGWVSISENRVKIHPLIRETVSQIPWTESEREPARREMDRLYREFTVLKQERGTMKDKEPAICRKSGLETAWAVLSHCGLDRKLRNEPVFKNLLLNTLLCAPKEQEERIIRGAEWLFSDQAYQDPCGIMELYDYVSYLCCQKQERKKARMYIRRAMAFAGNGKDPYEMGIVYDMLADYYETCLDGAYDAADEESGKLLRKLVQAVDASICWLEKSDRELAKKRLAKQKLGKAALFIRSRPEYRREIRTQILEVKRYLEETGWEDLELGEFYALICAWYHTLCERNAPAAAAYLNRAEQLQKKRSRSDLEWVDEFLIPAANMMLELGNGEASVSWLEDGWRRCCGHPEELPYVRKKLDLLQYETEVYEIMGMEAKKERLKKRRRMIEEDAKRYGMSLPIKD